MHLLLVPGFECLVIRFVQVDHACIQIFIH
jgi:hypothetical protein